MCGIGVIISSQSSSIEEVSVDEQLLIDKLSRRGPDSRNKIEISQTIFNTRLNFLGHVLHIQGDNICKQPILDKFGNIFLWNGEVFGGIFTPSSIADTIRLSEIISSKLTEHNDSLTIDQLLISIFGLVHGPFAFIFYHNISNKIYFGRDPFGRRSLVYNVFEDKLRMLSSVSVNASNGTWVELAIGGIYSIEASGLIESLQKYEWPVDQLKLARPLEVAPSPLSFQENSFQFLSLLKNAIQKRVNSFYLSDSEVHHLHFDHKKDDRLANIGVLFSGGIDSLLIARLLDQCLIDPNEPVELINIAFIDNEINGISAPDRLAAISGLIELKKLAPHRPWRLVHVDVTLEERMTYEDIIKSTIRPLDTHMDLNIGTAFWFASRGNGYLVEYSTDDLDILYEQQTSNGRPLLRLGEDGANKSVGLSEEVANLRKLIEHQKQSLKVNEDEEAEGENSNGFPCQEQLCQRIGKFGCIRQRCKRCCIRIHTNDLFEGKSQEEKIELQKNLLSYPNSCLVHRNKPSKVKKLKEKQAIKFQQHNEDNSIYKDKVGEEIEITDETIAVDQKKTNANEEEENPSDSLSQDELQAIYKLLYVNKTKVHYQSTCKALLIGIGADEQLAGYGRHRTVFNRSGWSGLAQEMNMDLKRLWQRNLGRDDRCVSDHGKEGWFPYLDEELVQFIQSLPLSKITDLSLPQGVGDKQILRFAAQHVGIEKGSQLVKRAIQFGTLAAKQTSVQYYGSRRKGKGESKI